MVHRRHVGFPSFAPICKLMELVVIFFAVLDSMASAEVGPSSSTEGIGGFVQVWSSS